MLDWLRGDDDTQGADDESPGEDLLGDADWEEDDDDLDGDLGMEGFEGDGGDDIAEVMDKVDEFEETIGSMSSTVNTVEHENAELSEDIEEVKDNVRKLLEIYEMVTRGVNPFADDDPFQTGAESGSFDIFGTDDEADGSDMMEEQDALMDDQFDDMEDFGMDDEFDDGFIEDAIDEESDEDEIDEQFDDAEPAEDDGRSFDDLKDDYGQEDTEDNPPEEQRTEEVDQDDAETNGRRHFDPEVYGGDGNGPLGEKPYLRTLPQGYASDLLIMRWIDELAEAEGATSAADTIVYYRAIGWLSEPVADELLAYAPGVDGDIADTGPQPTSSLPIDVHRRSLRYIHQLATTTSRQVVLTEPPAAADGMLDLDPAVEDEIDHIGQLSARTDGGGSFWSAIAGRDRWEPADPDHEGKR